MYAMISSHIRGRVLYTTRDVTMSRPQTGAITLAADSVSRMRSQKIDICIRTLSYFTFGFGIWGHQCHDTSSKSFRRTAAVAKGRRGGRRERAAAAERPRHRTPLHKCSEQREQICSRLEISTALVELDRFHQSPWVLRPLDTEHRNLLRPPTSV